MREVINKMRLYYHKTDGGAEYLMDAFIECPDGSKEGVFDGSKYIVRIDGDITKDAGLIVRDVPGTVCEDESHK